MKLKGEPAERQESEVRRYMDSDRMRRRYPAAYEKWTIAEGKLWERDAESQLTEIGHACREAMRSFATSLVGRVNPDGVETDPQKTDRRMMAVLQSSSTSESVTSTLEALYGFWSNVGKLAVRQEHGGLREHEPLTWEDGRRLVFLTIVVMTEIDRTVST
jgi:hypothetical protein